MTVTPTMQNSMNTSVHQAKLGNPPWMADIIEDTKAMIQASCNACQCWASGAVKSTHYAYRDGGQREGVTDDTADGKGRSSAMTVAVFHFVKRWRAQRAVRGHKSGEAGTRRRRGMLEGTKERTGGLRTSSRLASGAWCGPGIQTRA